MPLSPAFWSARKLTGSPASSATLISSTAPHLTMSVSPRFARLSTIQRLSALLSSGRVIALSG